MADSAWKIEIADAVVELRKRGEAISLVAVLSELRARQGLLPGSALSIEHALSVLLRDADMGEVGDLSDAF
jgi:hypothetical protein